MNVLLASTSSLFGGKYLEYIKEEIAELFSGIDEIIFIPFARPSGISHEEYTQIARDFFEQINIKVKGLHEFDDKSAAVNEAKGFFTGGGNTFLLVKTLHEENLMSVLSENVKSGKPYLGTSAGSNIAGMNMKTTNDMPIVYPPSFRTLGFVSFNINPHYLDPIEGSTHMGETRETRINEFHHFNPQPVVGLREGSWLEVKGDSVKLKGTLTARIFKRNETPIEVAPETELNELK